MNSAYDFTYDDISELNAFFQSESIDEWSCGYDEIGNLVFDFNQFTDYLRHQGC